MTKVRFLTLALMILIPMAALGNAEPVDLTDVFVKGGVVIDGLLVYQAGDILLIRGRTSDPAMADRAVRFATDRGHTRIANLIRIVPALGDERLERLVRYGLETSPDLAGCSFSVVAVKGIVYLRGEVVQQSQKHHAARLVARIDGVQAVESALVLSAPASVAGD